MKKTSTSRRRLRRPPIKLLVRKAIEARKNSSDNWTHVKTGSALLSAKGRIHTGANIESIVPDSSICAERVAIYKALSEGDRDFTHIAVVAFKDRLIYPCGTCRQVLAEHSKGLKIVLADLKGRFKTVTLSSLLPNVYL